MSDAVETGTEVVPEVSSNEPVTGGSDGVTSSFESLASAIQQEVLEAVKAKDMPKLVLVASYSGEVDRLRGAWEQGLPPSGKTGAKRGRKAKSKAA